MKREIPLFILDTNRRHKLGECDFITCTDSDSGFIAKIDYVEQYENYTDDTTRIECRNGVGARMKIKRVIGSNPDKGDIRTLMKLAYEYYKKVSQTNINSQNPTVGDCVNFLDALISGNRNNLDECGADVKERAIVMSSLNMLEEIKKRLIEK